MPITQYRIMSVLRTADLAIRTIRQTRANVRDAKQIISDLNSVIAHTEDEQARATTIQAIGLINSVHEMLTQFLDDEDIGITNIGIEIRHFDSAEGRNNRAASYRRQVKAKTTGKVNVPSWGEGPQPSYDDEERWLRENAKTIDGGKSAEQLVAEHEARNNAMADAIIKEVGLDEPKPVSPRRALELVKPKGDVVRNNVPPPEELLKIDQDPPSSEDIL